MKFQVIDKENGKVLDIDSTSQMSVDTAGRLCGNDSLSGLYALDPLKYEVRFPEHETLKQEINYIKKVIGEGRFSLLKYHRDEEERRHREEEKGLRLGIGLLRGALAKERTAHEALKAELEKAKKKITIGCDFYWRIVDAVKWGGIIDDVDVEKIIRECRLEVK